MKKVSILLGLLIISISTIFAQGNYKQGYIITLQQDTLRGYIDRNWETTPGVISFKKDLNDKRSTYKPGDINGFTVQQEHYISAVVPTLTDARVFLNNVNYKPDAAVKKKRVYLRVLVQGSKSLYQHVSRQNISSYYIASNGKFQLLSFKKYMKTVHENMHVATSVKENKKYIGQLLVYLGGCQKIKTEVSKVNYNRNDLIGVFRDYYQCTGTTPKLIEKAQKASVKYGVLAGVTATLPTFAGSNSYLTVAHFNPSINPAIGVFLDIILPGSSKKWAVHNELNYTSFKVNGSYSHYLDATDYTYADIQYGASAINLKSSIRYYMKGIQSSTFFDFGLTARAILGTTNHQKVTKMKFNQLQETVTESEAISNLKKVNFGAIVGVGYKYSDFSGELGYAFLRNIDDMPGVSTSVNRLSFLFTYYFK